VAQSRFIALDKILQGHMHGKLLDVGCSNGAFVDYARRSLWDAYGCDLSVEAVSQTMRPYCFEGSISNSRFNRRTFDVITFNDVLEHLQQPISALYRAKGLLKRTGMLVIDIPDMGCPEAKDQGAHFKHVKPREHLWYFTANQLRTVLESCGFNVVQMKVPLSGKVTAYACPNVNVEEVTIYGPPGIGDIMWTMSKLKAIREKEAPCRIKYVVCVDGQVKLAERAKDFILLSGLVDSCEFKPIPLPRDVGNDNPANAEYELIANDWIQPRRSAEDPKSYPLADWRPELATDYDLQIEVPEAAINQVKWRLKEYVDNYAAIYLSSIVWNRDAAIPEWAAANYAEFLIKLNAQGIKPVLIGAGWDNDFAKEVAVEVINMGCDPAKTWINTIGKTPIALAMAYMKLAKVTVGLCAGITMIPAHMGWPTVSLWPRKGGKQFLQFNEEFEWNWIPPNVLDARYSHLPVAGLSADKLVSEVIRKVRNEDTPEYVGCEGDNGGTA
jgi:hypothetical protein